MDARILLMVIAGCMLATVAGDGHGAEDSMCQARLEECTRVYGGEIHSEQDKEDYSNCVEVIDCSDDSEGMMKQADILQSIEDMVVHEHHSGSSMAQFSLATLALSLFLSLRR